MNALVFTSVVISDFHARVRARVLVRSSRNPTRPRPALNHSFPPSEWPNTSPYVLMAANRQATQKAEGRTKITEDVVKEREIIISSLEAELVSYKNEVIPAPPLGREISALGPCGGFHRPFAPWYGSLDREGTTLRAITLAFWYATDQMSSCETI